MKELLTVYLVPVVPRSGIRRIRPGSFSQEDETADVIGSASLCAIAAANRRLRNPQWRIALAAP
jgi:hypothetical protein